MRIKYGWRNVMSRLYHPSRCVLVLVSFLYYHPFDCEGFAYDLLPSIEYDKSDVNALIKSCSIYLSIYKTLYMCVYIRFLSCYPTAFLTNLEESSSLYRLYGHRDINSTSNTSNLGSSSSKVHPHQSSPWHSSPC